MSRPAVTSWYASPFTGLFRHWGPIPRRPHDPDVAAWSGLLPRWGADGSDLAVGGIGRDLASAEAAALGEAVERWQGRPLPTDRLIERLDILSGLDDQQLDRVTRLLRPRFTVPNKRIIRKGDRGDAVFFIASGAVEVTLPAHRVRLGSGEFFGEMALLSGRPRQADVTALTYCRLLALRKADFERFLAANPEARADIEKIVLVRRSMNEGDREEATADAV